MENTYYTWLMTMVQLGASAEYRITVASDHRNAAATHSHEQAIDVYPAILRLLKWNRCRSITVTAACGCSYRFEKFEDFVGHTCDQHYVEFLLNESDFE